MQEEGIDRERYVCDTGGFEPFGGLDVAATMEHLTGRLDQARMQTIRGSIDDPGGAGGAAQRLLGLPRQIDSIHLKLDPVPP